MERISPKYGAKLEAKRANDVPKANLQVTGCLGARAETNSLCSIGWNG